MWAAVTKTTLPPESRLHTYMRRGDFLDCYETDSPLPASEAAQIIAAFPGWAQRLVTLRNLITAPFGLREEGPKSADTIGFFPVEHRTGHEIIAGFDDRHLNFRICVRHDANKVRLATWVHPHNLGGRAYLRAILPFHILIVRNALARVAQTQTPKPLVT
ncbi:DUF2867 domain-containing protein [Roseobacter sp.]|uniref:DUF2867 domain-containing protein n=1 Tax=Roseobacter sp. TaxID=1907202 RepID=UPI003298E765